MGSDFSYNDLSKSEDIITDYTHRLIGHRTRRRATRCGPSRPMPKPGAPVVWGKVTMEIRDDYVFVGRDLLRSGHEARAAHDRR